MIELLADEAVFTCTRCGTQIAVGPHHRDLDPVSYVGLACGCLLVSRPARELRAVTDHARASQGAAA